MLLDTLLVVSQFADVAGNFMGGRIVSHMKAGSIVTLVLAVSTEL